MSRGGREPISIRPEVDIPKNKNKNKNTKNKQEPILRLGARPLRPGPSKKICKIDSYYTDLKISFIKLQWNLWNIRNA